MLLPEEPDDDSDVEEEVSIIKEIGASAMEVDQYHNQLVDSIRNNRLPDVSRLLSLRHLDLTRCHDNLLNLAVHHADVEVLAEVLGVEYPLRDDEKKVIVSKDMYLVLNSESSYDSNERITPLMTASYLGKRDMLSLLISCGADVNARTAMTSDLAVDFSLDQDDPLITLHLFENDSLFPNLEHSSRNARFRSFKERCPPLSELIQDREGIHQLLKEGKFCRSIQETLERGKYVYFVNSEGKSALFTAAVNGNYEAWGFLTAKEMKCFTKEEVSKVDSALRSNRDIFIRSLERYFYSVKGCHVEKMASRSLTFGENSNRHNFGKKIEGFFRYLDEEDSTSMLLQVLQDQVGLEVIFTTDLNNLKKILPVECSGIIYGLIDPKRNRVYVSAMESETQTYEDLVSNLGHELAHMVMRVVFQNGGLPYGEGELGRMEDFGRIVRKTRSQSKKCDKIIQRVFGYPEEFWERELIVRVPEMIAKYKGQIPNGVDLLRHQAPELLRYYEDVVKCVCNEYLLKIFTRNRIRNNDLIRYKKILSNYQDDSVRIGHYKDVEYYLHNKLKVMWVSSLKLGYSHLIAKFERDAKEILIVDWSQFLKCEDLFKNELTKHDIEYLAVIWDEGDDPKFCENSSCWRDDCPASHFQEMVHCVVMVTDKEPPNFRKGTVRLDYVWGDLSDATKQSIIQSRVNLNGTVITLKDIFNETTPEEDICKFMEQNLEANDIAHVLKGCDIEIGQRICERNEGETSSIHQSDLIPRTLCMTCVKLSTSLVERNLDCVFLVSAVDKSQLDLIGISEEYVTAWKFEGLDDVLMYNARCFLLETDNDCDEYTVFEELVTYYNYSDIGVCRVYFLKCCSGNLVVVASAFTKEGIVPKDLKTIEEEVKFCDAVGELVIDHGNSGQAADEHQDSTPLILADDPGCGKSIFLNWFAVKLKERKPSSWVSFVNLKEHANKQNFDKYPKIKLSEDETESLDFLHMMTRKSGTTFEEKLFEIYCGKRNEMFVFFDGLDEICPDFREHITSFLRALKKYTTIKLFLSTRLHERNHIVRALGGVSYGLVPFKHKEKVQLLDTHWNDLLKKLSREDKLEKLKNLKCELEKQLEKDVNSNGNYAVQILDEYLSSIEKNSEVNSINLQAVAVATLGRSSFKTITGMNLTENPLHLKIIGTVLTEGLFGTGDTWNLASLYRIVFESKVRVFNSEKIKAGSNVPADKSFRLLKEKCSNFLEKLAANMLIAQNIYDTIPEDFEFAVDTGMVTQQLYSERTFQFVHRTFAEFFFARWLVKNAHEVQVTNYWLHKLFLDKGLSRVREFVEDILCENAEQTATQLEIRIPKLTIPTGFFGFQRRKNDLCRCICGIVYHCKPQCLEFVVESLGERVMRQCFKEFQRVRWDREESSDVRSTLEGYRSTNGKFGRNSKSNAFHFALFCFDEIKSFPRERFTSLIRKLLTLLDDDGARSLKDFVCKDGLMGLFPKRIHLIGQQSVTYSETMVDFLTVKHKKMFGETVRRELLDPKRNVFRRTNDDNAMVLYYVFPSLADAFLLDTECSTLLQGNGEFFDGWCVFVSSERYDMITRVFNCILSKLREKDVLLKFLNGEDSKGFKVLTYALSNGDPRVPILLWDLEKELMNPDESKVWLIETLRQFAPSYSTRYCRFSSAFGFFSHLLKDGELTEEEASTLLLLKDSKNKPTYLDFHYPFPNLLTFYFFSSTLSRETARSLMSGIEFNYRDLLWEFHFTYGHGHKPPSHLIPFIVEEFDRIASLPRFDELNLIPIDDLKTGSQDNRKFILKGFISVLHACVQNDMEYYGSEYLFGRLRGPGYSFFYANILHEMGKIKPSPLPYVCSVLVHLMKKEDFQEMLFDRDEYGETLFHRSAWDYDLEMWRVLYDVARCVLGFDAITSVHAAKNDVGIRVLDYLVKNAVQ